MKQASKYLKILLWLIAIHSFTAGLFLIFLGEEGIQIFGFPAGNQFFQLQGGVFHIVMCVAYILASLDVPWNRKLIIFIISAKFIAFVYLLIYYFLFDHIMMVLISGIADGLMGLLVFLLWKESRKGADNG